MNDLLRWEEGIALVEMERENERLRQTIGQMDGVLGGVGDMDPYILNEFLRHALDFEDVEHGPKWELVSIFPESFCFPSLEVLSERQLREKLKAIYEVLWAHNIFVDLTDGLPDALIYAYITEQILQEQIPLEFPEGLNIHFLGCQGSCRECFQQEFCEGEDQVPLSF